MSNTTKHTPGPWWAIYNGTYWDIKTRRDRDPQDIGPYDYGASIGHVIGDQIESRTNGKETQEANARLIAAAPELLAVLKDLVDKYDAMQDGIIGSQLTNGDFFAAREAIKKAQP